MAHYEPPVQSKKGQLFDALTMLVLIFGTLFVTTYLTQEPPADAGDVASASRLADLSISDTERAQFQKLIDSGTTTEDAVIAAVDANQARADKYDISVPALVLTVVLLGGYLAFVYHRSLREYREVIDEKFGPRTGADAP